MDPENGEGRGRERRRGRCACLASEDVGARGAEELRDVELCGEAAVLAVAEESAVEPTVEGRLDAVKLEKHPACATQAPAAMAEGISGCVSPGSRGRQRRGGRRGREQGSLRGRTNELWGLVVPAALPGAVDGSGECVAVAAGGVLLGDERRGHGEGVLEVCVARLPVPVALPVARHRDLRATWGRGGSSDD